MQIAGKISDAAHSDRPMREISASNEWYFNLQDVKQAFTVA